MTTLILSGRHTEDAQALWRVAIARGWDVVRARGITVPPLPDPDAVIYVEALYGPPIAAAVGARAFAFGDDVVMGAGEYAPDTAEGAIDVGVGVGRRGHRGGDRAGDRARRGRHPLGHRRLAGRRAAGLGGGREIGIERGDR